MVYYKEEYQREDEVKDRTATQPLATVSECTLEREIALFHRYLIETSIF